MTAALQRPRLAYSVKQLIEASSLGKNSIYEAIRKGELVAKKKGARTLIPAAEAERWINSLPDANDGGNDGGTKA